MSCVYCHCRREPLWGSVEKRLAVLLSMGLYDAFALFESWALYFCLQSLKLVEFSLSVGTEVTLVLSSFLPDLPQDSHFSLQNPWLLVYSWRFPESFVLFCAWMMFPCTRSSHSEAHLVLFAGGGGSILYIFFKVDIFLLFENFVIVQLHLFCEQNEQYWGLGCQRERLPPWLWSDCFHFVGFSFSTELWFELKTRLCL